MTKQEKLEAFQEFLLGEGYLPQIDEHGHIVFKMEGKTYLVLFDDKDDKFFRIVFPGFWSIENDLERARVYSAALNATAETKVAKVFPVRDNTWATIELFVTNVDEAQAVFNRSISALQAAVHTFVEEMRNKASDD